MKQRHYKPINTQRLETWLGAEKIEQLRQAMRGWYGSPINLVDVPGSVWIDAQGDFTGQFNRGLFYGALDALEHYLKHVWSASKHPHHAVLHAGFTSVGDALARASGGFSQRRQFLKTGPTGVAAATSTLWRVGSQPAAGAAGAAAPAGTVHDGTNTGALQFANPAAGSLRLVGADVSTNVSNTLLLYDRLFSVAKTMNSVAAETVTGVPSRYQSTNPLDANEDYIGDNFVFVEVGGTALAATPHNWTPCTYTDQNNVAGQTLPLVIGNSGGIVDRLDQPTGQWFCPLASGDNGIKNLTNMQCSVAVATGSINFVIGHPLGFLAIPFTTLVYPFDWLTNRDQAPKIMDNACPAFLEIQKSSTAATTYNGRIYATSTAS
jgi:hypothetical protein